MRSRALGATLRSRAYAHPDVHIKLSARTDVVCCRAGTSRPELIGGALLELSAWTSEHCVVDTRT